MAQTLNINATLMCPHGGSVQIISSNTKLQVDGAFAALSTDQFLISGCPFTIPPGTPSPCLTVQWLVTDMQNTVGGNPTLSMASTGLCMSPAQVPQGPVTIVNAQTKVQTQ